MTSAEISTAALRRRIADLAQLPATLHNRDFLLTWKNTDEAVRSVLIAAEVIEQLYRGGLSTRLFQSGLGLSIFRDKSTRTRYAFRAACNLLGLMTEELDEKTSQVAHGETVRETATMISFATEVLGVRDDMYLGMGHNYMLEVRAALDESFAEGVLAQRPALINLQCDLDHPTQSLADLRHLISHFGSLEALRGKRIAMTWAYSPSYGKPLSVAQGIVSLMTRFGMDVVLAHPPGYELLDEPLQAARSHAEASGGSFEVTHSMDEAFENADIVYPKSWAPLAVMKRRTELLSQPESDAALGELERSCLAQNAEHKAWECNEDRMRRTKDGKALYMHCLPADISGVSCEAGEVSAPVFDRYRLDTYREASHKPFVIAAMALCTRFADPAATLGRCLDRNQKRRT
ncbi:MAG: knotted carbamoyltransferase YgeW [Myxococcales bacterium]|nr:knotted carbamoyltransferase YgeW [Myxococcales bacterium]